MLSVKEVSQKTGVSVRALHHYDQIGLLRPARVTEAGYRLYDENCLRRLHTILIYRELQFPLKEIHRMLDSPDYTPEEGLRQQIHLLEQQYKRIGRLIALAYDIQKNGVSEMDFKAFDRTEMEQYKEEAKARWGNTDAYREYAQRVLQKTDREIQQNSEELMQALTALAELKDHQPSADVVQQQVKAFQQCMTANYYTCTNEILAALGEMYVDNVRFTRNIDQACGDGSAMFIRDAIRAYCARS